jgi:hypothetical protein
MRGSMKAGLAVSAALLSLPAGAAFACGFQRSADASSQVQLAQSSDAARPARGPQSESSVSDQRAAGFVDDDYRRDKPAAGPQADGMKGKSRRSRKRESRPPPRKRLEGGRHRDARPQSSKRK